MNSRVFGICCLFGAGLLFHRSAAQNAYLESLFVGTEGPTRTEAPGAEDRLSEFQEVFLRSLGLRPRSGIVLPLSTLGERSGFEQIAAMTAAGNSSDVVVSMVLGPWRKDANHIELSALSSPQSETITIDYLLNLMLFHPSQAMVTFVVAPTQHPFPTEMFQKQQPGVGGGGKYLVVVQARNSTGYESVVDRFKDVLAEMEDPSGGDANGDGVLSFTEWLKLLVRKATAEFAISPYKILGGPDIGLRQLQ